MVKEQCIETEQTVGPYWEMFYIDHYGFSAMEKYPISPMQIVGHRSGDIHRHVRGH